MDKTFAFTLDDKIPVNPSNAFEFWRGDNVVFNFTFKNGSDDLTIPPNTTLRIFAKKIGPNGLVNKDDAPLFAGDFTTPTTASFNSSQTAGDAGNYLLAVMLMASDSSIITAQGIYFNLLENGYAGIYQPSEDFRDEVLDALEKALAAAAAASSSAEQSADSATSSANSAKAAALSANAAKQSADAAATSDSETAAMLAMAQEAQSNAAASATASAQSATDAQAAQAAAELAKNQAAEIVDPDNRIGKLFQTKLDTGVLYCNGGFAKVPQAAFTTLSKATMLVRFARKNTTRTADEYICNIGDGGSENTGISLRLLTDNRFSVLLKFKKADGTHYNSAIPAFDASAYLVGKIHSAAVCWSGTSAKIYIDGVLKGSALGIPSGAVISTSTIGITLAGRGKTNAQFFYGQVSDFAVLNYDASEVDSDGNYTSAYSIADYQNGKAIPPSMRPFSEVLGRNATWSVMGNAPVDVSVSGDVITLTTTAEISDTYFRIKPAGTINGRAGQTFRASIDSISGIGGYGLGVKPMKGTTEINQFNLTNNTKSGSVYNASAFDSFNLTIRYGSSPIPSGTVFTITGFRAWVNGAIVALENYTIARNTTTKLIKDASGNGNDATVSGVLAGDRDNAIAAFVDELKTQINQQA